MAMKLDELAGRIGARLEPDSAGGQTITGCAGLDEAGPEHVTFLANPRYRDRLARTWAAAVIVGPDLELEPNAAPAVRLVADDPYFAFREAMVALHGWREQPAPGIHPDAFVDPSAIVDELCTIRPGAYVAPGARIGRRCVIYPNVYVGKHAVVGDDCVLHPGVTIYERCRLGARVVLHAGVVIGGDGFGYATHNGVHHKLPAAGRVVVGDDVEMGAGCSVDRATTGVTAIGEGSKLSTHVAVGHGCRIGKHNLLVGQVGLAGSVSTGDHVVIGGQTGVAGHLHIGDRARVAAQSGVMTDLPPDGDYGGAPAQPLHDAKRNVLHGQRVPELARRLKRVEKQLGLDRAGE